MPRNARAGVRMSTALTYLAAARGRPNLTVLEPGDRPSRTSQPQTRMKMR